MIHGHTFTIDTAKVAAYSLRPMSAAELLASFVKDEDLMIGSVCLGKVQRTEVSGSELRIYVLLDDVVEHGTYQGG